MDEKRQLFLQNYKYRKNEENTISPLMYQSNYCCTQDPQTKAKISEWNIKEKQGIHIASKYLPSNIY